MQNLKTELNIQNLTLMYVGNLESYQGIDLLLESFALVVNQTAQADLVIIGGDSADILKYQIKTKELGIAHKVHFCGSQPTNHLGLYLAQADILISPRIKGKNTPMKVYSYLDSGKPVVATDLLTHTQVMNNQVAILAKPNAEDFSQGILSLINDQNLRLKLGRAGKQLVQEKHSYTAFSQKLNTLYDYLRLELSKNSELFIR
ncbi:glycosyltransferase family 4 protein [Calothrix rhizosoleniae]|uniref:glycosyltransferase family 4 protein n=1 Tax=Calothrix rhizosoleniae TaxID=888997 RepID=UPI000B49C35D|nr:glycosyltransferase family 4 protein [Calothrix rhizosoleniae]